MEANQEEHHHHPHPSLPSDYVTVRELRDRWLKQKHEKEREDHPSLPSDYVTVRELRERCLKREQDEEKEDRMKVNDDDEEQKDDAEKALASDNNGRNVEVYNLKEKGCEVEEGVKIEDEVDGVDQLKNDVMVNGAEKTVRKGAGTLWKKKWVERQRLEMINGVMGNVFPEKQNSELEERVLVMEKRNVAVDGECEGKEGEKEEKFGVKLKEKQSGVVGKLNVAKNRECREKKGREGGEKGVVSEGGEMAKTDVKVVKKVSVIEKVNLVAKKRMGMAVKRNVARNGECWEVKEIPGVEKGAVSGGTGRAETVVSTKEVSVPGKVNSVLDKPKVVAAGKKNVECRQEEEAEVEEKGGYVNGADHIVVKMGERRVEWENEVGLGGREDEIETKVKEVSGRGRWWRPRGSTPVNGGGWKGYHRYDMGERREYGRVPRDEGLMWVKKKKKETSENGAVN